MELWMWPAWAIVLFIQNASWSAVSRARNSGSLRYHAVVGLFSNGIWFLSFAFMFHNIFNALIVDKRIWFIAVLGVFYTVCTLAGSIWSHWFMMRLEAKHGGLLDRRR